jgi:hypothetical protein
MGSVRPKLRHSVLFESSHLSSSMCSSIIFASRPYSWLEENGGGKYSRAERYDTAPVTCSSPWAPQLASPSDLCLCTFTTMASAATENNFRSSLSQFRWARGVTDDSQARDAGNSRNPFSRFYNAIGGAYVPLRSSENSNEEEAYFALSRWER